jgi:hypothetical protein
LSKKLPKNFDRNVDPRKDGTAGKATPEVVKPEVVKPASGSKPITGQPTLAPQSDQKASLVQGKLDQAEAAKDPGSASSDPAPTGVDPESFVSWGDIAATIERNIIDTYLEKKFG